MKTKKQKKLVALLALLVVAVLGATFAYFNQTLTAENPFDTNKYDSTLTEDFDPSKGDNWEPGAQVDKVVAVENTGDYPIVVRAKFEDTWVNKESKKTIFTSAKGRDESTGQVKTDDGLVEGDTSVVQLILNKDNWTYNSTDGYWYFKQVLQPGKSTEAFLNAVKLLEDTDMGTYNVTKYYTKAATKPDKDNIGDNPLTQWVEYTGNVPDGSLHNMTKTVQDKPGYSNADYTLKITAQTVQATKAAAEAAFGTANVLSDWNLK